MKKQRLDLELVSRSLAPTLSQAQTLIRIGRVFLNEQKAITPSQQASKEDKIFIKEPLKYVSRGGLKLEHALQEFKINPNNQTCLDIGSSTGGFTDCLLQNGANHVYALDVGTHQLSDKLLSNPKVTSTEQTHFLKIPKLPNPKISLVTIDVSFISSKKILLHLLDIACTRKGENRELEIVLLLKPQFESSPKYLKKGVIRDPEIHQKIIDKFTLFCENNNIDIKNQTTSPIKGPKGNTEFLFHLTI